MLAIQIRRICRHLIYKMETEKIHQICAKGKEELYYGKNLEKIGKLDEAIKWYYKARETMNEIFPDNSIQNRNLMRHLYKIKVYRVSGFWERGSQ